MPQIRVVMKLLANSGQGKSLFDLFLANSCNRVTSLDFSGQISVDDVRDIKKENPEQKVSEKVTFE